MRRRAPVAGGALAVVLLLLGASACATGEAGASEHTTTWRAGDPAAFHFGCPTPVPLLDLDEGGYVRSGSGCWVAQRGAVPAILVEWFSGPHEVPQEIGSIWRVRDIERDEVIVCEVRMHVLKRGYDG